MVQAIYFRSGSKVSLRGSFDSRPLSGGKQNQSPMMADNWAPTSAVGGTFPVAGTFLALPLLAKSGNARGSSPIQKPGHRMNCEFVDPTNHPRQSSASLEGFVSTCDSMWSQVFTPCESLIIGSGPILGTQSFIRFPWRGLNCHNKL